MDKITVKKDAPPPSGLVPTTVKWKSTPSGEFSEHNDHEKCYRALMKALSSHYAKKTPAQLAKTPAEKNVQFSIQGPEFYIGKCDRTTAGKQSSYHATGRARVWVHNMASDGASEETVAFDLSFKDSRDEWRHLDIEIVSATVDAMPRGTPLSP